MKLRKLKIQNFRGIKHLELDLDDVTVLIGENNSGKTAVLDALRLCLRNLTSRRSLVFDSFDFHLNDASAEPSSAEPIQITITFSEDKLGDWDAQTVSRLSRSRILQVDEEGRSHVVLHVTCAYDTTLRDLNQQWEFRNLDGIPLIGVPDSTLSALQREVAYFYLAALRDAARHFDARGPYWRPFLKDSQLPTEKKTEIEQKLREVNDLVVGSHASFEQAMSRLRKVQDVVPVAKEDVVSIEAVPGRIFDMLAKAQIHLGTATGAKIPVGRHGEGTQSLAVLMLFSAFLDSWPEGSPIIALEEPEAHLHPSAVRSLWNVVGGITGQKLISTHSGDLISEIPVNALRRLAKTVDGVRGFRLQPETLTADDERKFNFNIRSTRGELLFARTWILVEGETEVILLAEIARYLGISLEQVGIRCVPHRAAGVEIYLKVAKDMGIKWCVLTDNDLQGGHDQKHVRNYTSVDDLNDVLYTMPASDIESYLCSIGFGSVYEAYLSPQTRNRVTVSQAEPEYWTQVLAATKKSLVKPAAAQEVIALIRSGIQPVPPLLEAVIRSAVKLSGSA